MNGPIDRSSCTSEASELSWPQAKILKSLTAHHDLITRELSYQRRQDDLLLCAHPLHEVIRKGHILCALSVHRHDVSEWKDAKIQKIVFIRANKFNEPTFFKSNSLRPGNQVILQNEDIEWDNYWKEGMRVQMGTVSEIRPTEITVIIEQDRVGGASTEFSPSRTTRMVKYVNYNTYAVLLATLQALAGAFGSSLPNSSEDLRGGPGAGIPFTSTDELLLNWASNGGAIKDTMQGLLTPLTRALVDPIHFQSFWVTQKGGVDRALPALPLPFFHPNLNEQQVKAIKNSLYLPSVTYVKQSALLRKIHGPEERKLVGHSSEEGNKQEGIQTRQPEDLFWLRAKIAEDHARGQASACWLPLHLIHGPPGTGKTSTIVELIMQTVCGIRIAHGLGTRAPRILIAAPTHSAIDSVAEHLISKKAPWASALEDGLFHLERLGNLVKMRPSVAAYETNRRNPKDRKEKGEQNSKTKTTASALLQNQEKGKPQGSPGSRPPESGDKKDLPADKEKEGAGPEMEQDEGSLYRVMEVVPSTTMAGLRKAYLRLALKLHPDKCLGNTDEATQKFKVLITAFETLTDPKSRRKHDRVHLRDPSLKASTATAASGCTMSEAPGGPESPDEAEKSNREPGNTKPASQDKEEADESAQNAGSSEQEAVRDVPVVKMATLHSTSKVVGAFDIIIIDEAAQSIELLNWVALMRQHAQGEGLTKLVLVGDPKQLPPLVFTGPPPDQDGTNGPKMNRGAPTPPKSLRATMFERLAETYCPAGLGATVSTSDTGPLTLLTTQYRFNEDIQKFPSQAMYDSYLQAAKQNRSLRLSSLFTEPKFDSVIPALAEDYVYNWNARCITPPPKGSRYPSKREMEDELRKAFTKTGVKGQQSKESPQNLDAPLVVYDTSHHNLSEGFDRASNSQSRNNVGELILALRHVIHLLHRGVRAEQIAIVSPYYGQISTLRELRLVNPQNGNLIRVSKYLPRLHMSTCDSTQGQEFDVVIFTCVRSNPHGRVGFLSDARRLNVAMTRAKRQLCVIGDFYTLTLVRESRRAFLLKWIHHLKAEASFLPADESRNFRTQIKN